VSHRTVATPPSSRFTAALRRTPSRPSTGLQGRPAPAAKRALALPRQDLYTRPIEADEARACFAARRVFEARREHHQRRLPDPRHHRQSLVYGPSTGRWAWTPRARSYDWGWTTGHGLGRHLVNLTRGGQRNGQCGRQDPDTRVGTGSHLTAILLEMLKHPSGNRCTEPRRERMTTSATPPVAAATC